MRTRTRFVPLLILLLLASGCAPAPPTLSPAGTAAFHALRVGRVLDLVRNVAIDANAQTPPLFSTESTRKIITWHEASVKTIVAVPDGWRPVVLAGLDQLQKELPAAEWQHIALYVTLARTVIAEVP